MSYPSTFLTLQNAVIAKGRLDPGADRDKVKDWLNQVQADANLQTEALVSIAQMTPTGSPSETLAAAALRVKAMFVTTGGQAYKPMEPVSLQQILEWRQGTPVSSTSQGPYRYAFLGVNEIEFYPTPAGTETITLYYVRAPAIMVNDSDTPELPEPFASKLLEYGALAEAADFKRDDALQMYQAKYEDWVKKLRAHLTRKKGGLPEQMLVLGTGMFRPHDPSTDLGW